MQALDALKSLFGAGTAAKTATSAAAAASNSIPDGAKLPARLLDSFGPSNFGYSFESRIVNPVPPPALGDDGWHESCEVVYAHPLITYTAADPAAQPVAGGPAHACNTFKTALSVEALADDRKRVAAAAPIPPALLELQSDITLVRSAFNHLLTPSGAAALLSNPYADLVMSDAGPYLSCSSAYAMAEIDHFHALTPPAGAASTADDKRVISFVELGGNPMDGGGATEYMFHRFGGGSGGGGASGAVKTRGWGYALRADDVKNGWRIGAWKSESARAATKHTSTATPPNFVVYATDTPPTAAASGATSVPAAAAAAAATATASAAVDPLAWSEASKFSTEIDKQTNKLGVQLVAALDRSPAANRLAAERRFVFELVTALNVLAAGGSFVCLIPAEIWDTEPAIAAAAVPAVITMSDDIKATTSAGGSAAAGPASLSPFLLSLLHVCGAHFQTVAIQPLTVFVPPVSTESSGTPSRALVCRQLIHRSPKAALQLLMWYSKVNKWSADPKNAATAASLPAPLLDAVLSDGEFLSFVRHAHVLCARYELYSLLTSYRKLTEPGFVLPQQMLATANNKLLPLLSLFATKPASTSAAAAAKK